MRSRVELCVYTNGLDWALDNSNTSKTNFDLADSRNGSYWEGTSMKTTPGDKPPLKQSRQLLEKHKAPLASWSDPLNGPFQVWQVAWYLISIFSGLLVSGPRLQIRCLNIGEEHQNLWNPNLPLFIRFIYVRSMIAFIKLTWNSEAFQMLSIIAVT